MIRRALVLALALLNAGATADAQVLKLDTRYDRARPSIQAAGWKPTDYAVETDYATPNDKAAKLAEHAAFKKLHMPEAGSCFGTGLGQCFGIWRKANRVLVVELVDGPHGVPQIYFYYQARLHQPGRPVRAGWDLRSADIVPGTHPKWRRQW